MIKPTELNAITTLEGSDVFMVTHENGLTEKISSENLFKNGSKTIVLTRAEYDALGGDYQQDAIYAISDESTGGINVDQTYDPEGVNPLSGQAVAEAIGKGKLTVVTVQITQTGTTRFSFTELGINVEHNALVLGCMVKYRDSGSYYQLFQTSNFEYLINNSYLRVDMNIQLDAYMNTPINFLIFYW